MKNFYKKIVNKKKGFTLAEVLLVISVFAIISVIAIPVYSSWQSLTILEQDADEIAEMFKDAQVKSSARLHNSAYGVYINTENKKITLYQGNSYAERNEAYDQEKEIDNNLALINNLSADDVTFSKGLGEPSATGTLSLINNSSGEEKNISINSYGVVSEN
jgi:prepilin-type N-terminal cleavage/methylation domain-containing protein